jgi:hypothetical protein
MYAATLIFPAKWAPSFTKALTTDRLTFASRATLEMPAARTRLRKRVVRFARIAENHRISFGHVLDRGDVHRSRDRLQSLRTLSAVAIGASAIGALSIARVAIRHGRVAIAAGRSRVGSGGLSESRSRRPPNNYQMSW